MPGNNSSNSGQPQPSTASDEDAGTQPAGTSTELPQLWIGATETLTVLTGQYGPDRSAQQLYGADLGFSVQERDRLWIVFGDAWVNPLVRTIDVGANQDADDAIAYIDLNKYSSGKVLEQLVRDNPTAGAEYTWQSQEPKLQFVLNETSKVATPLRQVRDGMMLSSGSGLTPLTAFANLSPGDAGGVFGLFFRNYSLECTDGACSDGRTCDAGLGLCLNQDGQRDGMSSVPCVLGQASMSACPRCEAVKGNGLCVDTLSSVFDANVPRGRTASVAMTHEVGNMVKGSDRLFATQSWSTSRFVTAASRSVRDFSVDRALGAGNDYRSGDGQNPEHEGVFLWGRPQFGGVRRGGRDVQLYLAWVPMPRYAEDGHFDWKPTFYTGQDAEGRPQFTERELDAQPLDLDAAQSGNQPEEAIDVVGHTSVVYLPTLKRWIMIFGGGAQSLLTDILLGDDAQLLDASSIGPIYVRFAEQPWGPWTTPQVFADDGDSLGLTGMYAVGGVMRSLRCNDPGCVRGEPGLIEDGGLYAPNIIEPWIEARADRVDIYWNVSNWNPYEVLLMKTSLFTSMPMPMPMPQPASP